jgi:antitoxin YefM
MPRPPAQFYRQYQNDDSDQTISPNILVGVWFPNPCLANDRPLILAIIDKQNHNKTPMTTTLNFNQTFEQLCEQAISTRQPVEIQQEGRESVSLIPTAELNSLLETAYLFSSQENADRLLDSLKRAKARSNQPRTLETLRLHYNP